MITAGGTSEAIDDVRRITNSGTGTLGARIAEAFAASGYDCHIAYICSAGAVRPDAERSRKLSGRGAGVSEAADVSGSAPGGGCFEIDVRIADDVSAVEAAVRQACAETGFDVIIHSMAIGDYRVRAVSDAELMADGVIERLSVLACGDSSSPDEAVRDALLSPPGIRESKISSDKENLVIVLEKAPKIIALYRGLAPGAVIVGFKLLSNAEEGELVRAGLALLMKNDCDFVLANDISTVRAGLHAGLLVCRDGTYERTSGKEGIAALIVKRVLERFL